jgi:16S rRNA pseudouridine516 synthase
MAAACGSHVNKLHRVSMGGLELDENLPEGQCREITAEELKMITE